MLRAFASALVSCLLLIVSSCAGRSAENENPSHGGSGEGGAQAGSSASGGSTAIAGKGGSSSSAGNGSGGGGSSNAGSSSGGNGSGGTSNSDQPDCETDFDALDKSCSSADDCTLVHHQIDCCGSVLIMGLSSSAEPAFDALEQYCSAEFPACECPPHVTLEDGSPVSASSSAAVECVEQRCRSKGETPTSCGDEACTADQYCYEFVGGPAGSMPSYQCQELGECQDCECLGYAGCTCSGTGSGIKVFCAAP